MAEIHFKSSIKIKPSFFKPYHNLGNMLLKQGRSDEALIVYQKAIAVKPDFAIAHHNLSTIKKYTVEDEHFLQVQELYKREDLNEDDRCFLSFALAKMYEDIGELDQAFHYLSKGNALQKNY